MSQNNELIRRVKRLSIELPILKGAFNQSVETECSIEGIEPTFNAMSDYCNALADELVGRGPACNKLAVALRGGLDIPEPYAYIFDAIVELESVKEPSYDPFELHHDRMDKEEATRPQIAQAWFEQLTYSDRKQLIADKGTREGVIKKIEKDIDNLRARRKRASRKKKRS